MLEPILHRALLAAVLAMPATVHAEPSSQVVLRMKGGEFHVSGELRAYDGNRFVIETPQFGRMTLSAARFDCIGAACSAPVVSAAWASEPLRPGRSEALTIRGADVLADRLLPTLVRAWAAAGNMQAVQVIGPEAGETRFQITDQKGRELAAVGIAPGNAGQAIVALEKGDAAIALADRPATPAELEALVAAGPKVRTTQHEHAVAADGLALIVAPRSHLTAMPLATAARILAGEIGDWYELGQPPGRIQVYVREEGSAAADRVEQAILRPRGLKLAAGAARVASEAALADAVARDPAGFGVVSLASVRSARPLGLETGCGIVQRPTPFAVKAEEYPLSYRLFLYAAAPPREAAARSLLRFVAAPEAQAAITEAGFVSQSIETLPLDGQGERMANALNATGEAFDLYHMRILLGDVKGARRLTTTLRATSTGDLDQKGRHDIARLANRLQAPELAGKRVLVLGFTDTSTGKFMTGIGASFKRAANVRAAILAAAGPRLDQRLVVAKGYGPLAPVACNDTAEGQRLNRRVEIWVRD